MHEAIERTVEKHDLDNALMERAMEAILTGKASSAQVAAFLVALRIKGETAEELAAAAKVMRRHCLRVDFVTDKALLDTCGTGGDRSGTFNISTITAIVVSACGVMVAKHGNRAASSRAGSADLLEELGVMLEMPIETLVTCLEKIGICFMFARAHHPAMRYAAPVRSELAIRTLFNLIGPLTNPAGATHQLLGIYDGSRLEQMARVLAILGSKRAWVVHGEEGLDEVSPTGTTRVAQLDSGVISTFELKPEDFGIERVSLESLKGGDAKQNAAIAREILAGQKGPYRNAVLVNAAAALCVAGEADSPRRGVDLASEAIDSGAARAKLDEWIIYGRRE
ncbi:MAG: anthranilate phosphoribosyltransferase [Deltaproteobacteria bacterium]|nr:anthranilate phosphoribosyltransferase [Deltaproteobacteria bacterium]